MAEFRLAIVNCKSEKKKGYFPRAYSPDNLFVAINYLLRYNHLILPGHLSACTNIQYLSMISSPNYKRSKKISVSFRTISSQCLHFDSSLQSLFAQIVWKIISGYMLSFIKLLVVAVLEIGHLQESSPKSPMIPHTNIVKQDRADKQAGGFFVSFFFSLRFIQQRNAC